MTYSDLTDFDLISLASQAEDGLTREVACRFEQALRESKKPAQRVFAPVAPVDTPVQFTLDLGPA